MKDTSKENGTKKGLFAAVWESMTKTGGCCGSGGNCGGPAQPDGDKKQTEEEPSARNSDATGKRRQ